MTASDYLPNVQRLAELVNQIAALPLDELASLNEHWQAVGPIIDPTAFAVGGSNLTDQRDLISAARDLCGAARKIVDRNARQASV